MSAYYIPTFETTLQIPPPPPSGMGDQIVYTGHLGRGPIGPVIGVLITIAILGAASVLFGRFCSGPRRNPGQNQYDIESYVENKCSSCIDGGSDPVPPQPQPAPVAQVAAGQNQASSSRQAAAATPPPRRTPRAAPPTPAEEKKEEGGGSEEPQRAQAES